MPFLAALPVLWLVASAQLPRAAAPLGALLTVAMPWVPLLTNNGHLHAHAQQRLARTSSSSALPVLCDRAGAPLSSSARPIARAIRDEHGRAEGSVLSFSDVTELVDALQAKDEFVAGISHELRTPLTSIRGYTELLAMDDRLPGSAHAGLEVIERNADQLLSLVDDRLNSHRDTADLHVVPADLVALLEQSAEAAQPHADRAGISVKVWAPDTLVVDCDPVRMRQVLDNLVSNAIKYSPASSTVFVLGTRPGDSAQVQVIDHGHGMSPEDVRRGFEKFYRGASAVPPAE